jgi:hypothetical protein
MNNQARGVSFTVVRGSILLSLDNCSLEAPRRSLPARRRGVAARHISVGTPRRSLAVRRRRGAVRRRRVATRHISVETPHRRVAVRHISVEAPRRSLPAWRLRVAAWHISVEPTPGCSIRPRRWRWSAMATAPSSPWPMTSKGIRRNSPSSSRSHVHLEGQIHVAEKALLDHLGRVLLPAPSRALRRGSVPDRASLPWLIELENILFFIRGPYQIVPISFT